MPYFESPFFANSILLTYGKPNSGEIDWRKRLAILKKLKRGDSSSSEIDFRKNLDYYTRFLLRDEVDFGIKIIENKVFPNIPKDSNQDDSFDFESKEYVYFFNKIVGIIKERINQNDNIEIVIKILDFAYPNCATYNDLFVLIQYYRQINCIEKAIQLIDEEIIDILIESEYLSNNENEIIRDAYEQKGDMLKELGRHFEAIDNYNSALKYSNDLDDNVEQAFYLISNIGEVYLGLNLLSEAEQSFKDAESKIIHEKYNVSQINCAYIYWRLAYVSMLQNNNNKALEYIKKSINHASDAGEEIDFIESILDDGVQIESKVRNTLFPASRLAKLIKGENGDNVEIEHLFSTNLLKGLEIKPWVKNEPDCN